MNNRQRKVEPVLPANAESGLSESAAAQAAQAGAMLRQLRESVGVDSMLLASALKVSPQKIQALEEGYLNGLPGLAFARSLATAICRHFAADPAPVLALMPQAIPDFPAENRAPRELFKPSAFGASGRDWGGRPHWRAGTPGWLLVVVVVLLIGTLAVWFIPGWHPNVSATQVTSRTADAGKLAISAASAVMDEAPGPIVRPASQLEAAPTPKVPLGSAPVASVAALPYPSAGRPITVPAIPSPASEPTASAVSSAIAAAGPNAGQSSSGTMEQNVVMFTATGRVWIGVYDGSGEPLLNRILTDGDAVSVGGELPLTVTVGNKNAVIVTVRGQPLDLSKHTHGGRVARFTVDRATDNP
jgi:cytoskeleton protein RodZ